MGVSHTYLQQQKHTSVNLHCELKMNLMVSTFPQSLPIEKIINKKKINKKIKKIKTLADTPNGHDYEETMEGSRILPW